jgi:predicted acylesterase/phospholipase RssA
MIDRRRFLLSLGATALAPALLAASTDDATDESLARALVLSGGGARGAYEAGVVGELAAVGGVTDGSPLPPYEVVCGTSIGALNGWFVATAQYTKLRDMWFTISAANLIHLKRQFAALRDPESGVLDRAAALVALSGLASNQRALLQNEPVFDWIRRNIDATKPLQVPLVWATTNLTEQRTEYFFVRPNRDAEIPAALQRALLRNVGPHTVVREATPDLLHRAIFASAAIPLAFDPVLIPNPDGRIDQYCDGGVASNSPVGIAHAISRRADVVLLDPPFEPETQYTDAVEVAFGAYGTMQRKILESEMRSAYFESAGERAFARLGTQDAVKAAQGDSDLATLIETSHTIDLRYLRPAKELPLGVVAFNDEVGIYDAYRVGWEDAARGFTPYKWETFYL